MNAREVIFSRDGFVAASLDCIVVFDRVPGGHAGRKLEATSRVTAGANPVLIRRREADHFIDVLSYDVDVGVDRKESGHYIIGVLNVGTAAVVACLAHDARGYIPNTRLLFAEYPDQLFDFGRRHRRDVFLYTEQIRMRLFQVAEHVEVEASWTVSNAFDLTNQPVTDWLCRMTTRTFFRRIRSPKVWQRGPSDSDRQRLARLHAGRRRRGPQAATGVDRSSSRRVKTCSLS